jgi:hypothetical protein
MCEDCRVIVVAQAGFDPHGPPRRPKLRTTEDYLRERESGGGPGSAVAYWLRSTPNATPARQTTARLRMRRSRSVRSGASL